MVIEHNGNKIYKFSDGDEDYFVVPPYRYADLDTAKQAIDDGTQEANKADYLEQALEFN